MNVVLSEFAEINLRSLGDDDRRKVGAWIDYLRSWETNSFIRQYAKKLDFDGDVYMLLTNTDFRVFFEVEKDTITVLHVARKDVIIRFGQVSGTNPP